MKKFTIIVILALAGLFVTSCNNEQNTVRSTVRDFCKAFFEEGDFAKASQYTSGEAHSQLQSIIDYRTDAGAEYDAFMADLGIHNMRFDIDDVRIEGNVATAYVKLKAKDASKDKLELDEIISLVKNNGKWYVTEF